jgi:hypothetical protein
VQIGYMFGHCCLTSSSEVFQNYTCIASPKRRGSKRPINEALIFYQTRFLPFGGLESCRWWCQTTVSNGMHNIIAIEFDSLSHTPSGLHYMTSNSLNLWVASLRVRLVVRRFQVDMFDGHNIRKHIQSNLPIWPPLLLVTCI